jgi:hypothetical protein
MLVRYEWEIVWVEAAGATLSKIGTFLGNTPVNYASPVRTVSGLAGIQAGAFQSHLHHSTSEPSFFLFCDVICFYLQ